MTTTTLRTIGALAIIVAAGAGIGFSASGLKDEQPVKLSEVPAAVRTTIEQHAKGGKIEEIERSSEGGRTLFEVQVEGPGGDFEFVVAEDGVFLGKGGEEADDEEAGADQGNGEQVEQMSLADAPAAVRDAFIRRSDGAKPSKVERIVDEGVTKYEIEFEQAAGTASMTFADQGDILEVETPVQVDAIPGAIRREIQKDHPGALIKSAESVQLFYYEMDVVVNGKTIEVAALATGDIEDRLLGGEEADHEDEHADHDNDHEDRGRGRHDENDDD